MPTTWKTSPSKAASSSRGANPTSTIQPASCTAALKSESLRPTVFIPSIPASSRWLPISQMLVLIASSGIPALDNPLVTIGVPVYQGQADLPITLECLRTQTYQNLDVLISVDAGDQQSAAACQPFLRRDARFRMHVQPSRLGWAGNTDWTMQQRRGDFYIFQQHDDQV